MTLCIADFCGATRSCIAASLLLIVFWVASLGSVQRAGAAESSQVDPEAEDFLAIYKNYQEYCAVCHGRELQGAAQGVALVGRELTHGEGLDMLVESIRKGFPEKGMPAWGMTMADAELQAMAIFIKERRLGWINGEYEVSDPVRIPAGPVSSEDNTFVVEVLSDEIDGLPYAMDYLPDGRILVTEKYHGLATIDRNGKKTYIRNTPQLSSNSNFFLELDKGTGWILGVAVHPEYQTNGWVYLAYGDTCEDCEKLNKDSPLLPTMTRLIRGRIRGDAWVDEEDIWQASRDFYTQETDMVAGGILALDGQGYVFMTVGVKGGYIVGVQDPSTPYGKVLRLHDDGRVPEDNPFIDVPGAEKAVWAYGFRNPEGLFYDRQTQRLWSSDNGPRGGDEVNLVRTGLNYGWPLFSLGVNYDGTTVEYGKQLGIDFDIADIEQPVVDLTPSPAVANLMVYRGDKFPSWKGNIFLATMRARTLYRIEIDENLASHHIERLIPGISRVRDVKESPEGYIDVLLENPDGGKIVRLKPVSNN